jgi:hypothetical protein
MPGCVEEKPEALLSWVLKHLLASKSTNTQVKAIRNPETPAKIFEFH